MMASGHHVSIDAPFGEDDDNSMADVMSSGDDSRTDKHVDHESMAQELKQVLNKCLKEKRAQDRYAPASVSTRPRRVWKKSETRWD